MLPSKCSKISNAFLILSSNKMLAIRSRIYKMLVRIANREGPDIQGKCGISMGESSKILKIVIFRKSNLNLRLAVRLQNMNCENKCEKLSKSG